ncbi:MAG: biotin carboxylase N-terminal domain-containing protein, partial [Patescibacteria group bacterium]
MPRREAEFTPEVITPINKLLIANRGEIAVRAARACQERGITAVIPYSLEDSQTLIARMADEQEGWELAPIGGVSADESYANPEKILDEAKFRGCDAIFLGYGFLSEDAAFIRHCQEAKIRVLAPPASVMELTGNKIRARETAKKVKIGRLAHIPVLEGTGNLATFQDASREAPQLTYPVMLKDPDTGGGMGNLVAHNREELERTYQQLRLRPGNKEVFMERFIQNAAHIEVQIAADRYGNVVSLGERDCTMQRRHQKIVEESPAPGISRHLREVIQTAAVNFARDINYQGVGTWEFIFD